MSTQGTEIIELESPPEGFDEAAYLMAYPDIAESVLSGTWKSALHHYHAHGAAENRLADRRYLNALRGGDTAQFVAANVDLAYVARSKYCLVSGWAEDRDGAQLGCITLTYDGGVAGVDERIARCRRIDVEEQRPSATLGLCGFWSLLTVRRPESANGELTVMLAAGRERRTFTCKEHIVSEERLREAAFGYLAGARYLGDPTTEAFLQLDRGIGRALIEFNMELSLRFASGAHVVRFDAASRKSYDGSVIVCLYGKPDFLMLQAALFSSCPGSTNYEYIYVSNSPELTDRLVKDATIACRIYGLSITLVLLPGNVGFGLANNAAVNAARTSRILLVNPDVLPRESDWPLRHTTIVRNLPPEQVSLFGVPLYYGDGSLMHGGMYFEVEEGLSASNQRMLSTQIVRTEHYGKGAPPEAARFLQPRPVPAVTGAFMSLDRGWFESLGGFSPEFVFGHYEDADLCLRSLQAGRPAWIQNLPFWHLESRGSTHHPAHEGGRLVNRWNMSRRWGQYVTSELNGENPQLFAS